MCQPFIFKINFLKLKNKSTMKNLKCILSLLIVVFTFSYTFSQGNGNYFNTSNMKYIPVYNPSFPYTVGNMKFDLSEINISNSRLDLASTSNLNNIVNSHYGHWNQNNGDGNFGTYNQFYQGDYTSGDMNDILFVKLRDGNNPKDVVIAKTDGLQIHQNSNNTINGVYQFLSNGSGTYLDAGGAFDWNDNREDVAVLSNNQIKIFKNTGGGTLEPNPWTFSLSADKLKLKQMTDKNILFIQNSEYDKSDLIIYKYEYNNSRTRITVLKNNGNNGFEAVPFADLYVDFFVNDIEIADLNNDNYNDIIVVGNNRAIAFANESGQSVNSRPYIDIIGIPNNPLVAIVDVDRDGFNDIITTGYQGYTKLYLATDFGTPAQTFFASDPYFSVNSIKAVDVYDKGSITLLLSFAGGNMTNSDYGIKLVPPVNIDPAPAPPLLLKNFEPDGSLYRPRIVMIDKGNRDFHHYQIWKKKGTGNFNLLADNITNSYYIDYTEYIVDNQDGPGQGINNCFLKLKK